jgi:hypothetical protein
MKEKTLKILLRILCLGVYHVGARVLGTTGSASTDFPASKPPAAMGESTSAQAAGTSSQQTPPPHVSRLLHALLSIKLLEHQLNVISQNCLPAAEGGAIWPQDFRILSYLTMLKYQLEAIYLYGFPTLTSAQVVDLECRKFFFSECPPQFFNSLISLLPSSPQAFK